MLCYITVLNYLARYIHRVAITNSRIISNDNGKVTFRYKDSKSGTYIKTMTVSAGSSSGVFFSMCYRPVFTKCVTYGLWSPSNRKKLHKMQQILTQPENNQQERLEEDMMRRYLLVSTETMPPLQEGNTRLYRASVSAGEGATVREHTLISSAIKSHPKHEPSGYITIPVHPIQ